LSWIRITTVFAWFGSSAALALGCSDDAENPPGEVEQPLFAESWATDYTEVRDCRKSGDHDLNYIRVVASDVALATYQNRDQPFPVESILLKPEYADDGCTDLVGYTVMKKGEAGSSEATGDWVFQRVGSDGLVDTKADLQRCTGCHTSCGVAPDGHDWTCAVP
jgi:hypothetical protein